MNSEGTHFYHSHTGNTRAEGTYGVIAFKNRAPKHQYDGEFSLVLSDWYHESVLDLTAGEYLGLLWHVACIQKWIYSKISSEFIWYDFSILVT